MKTQLLCLATTLALAHAIANEPACNTVGNVTTCRIDQPDVMRPSTTYPTIRFSTGDQVLVNAGGCVQTGGHGRTWKRYVDPSGSGADRLYHGLILIPGVNSGLERVAGFIGRPLDVGPGIVNQSLVLGYEDDEYSDNGYWSHDDGTGDQCKGVGPAWVSLQVAHPVAQPPQQPPASNGKPMDLVSMELDFNGVPLNPRWQYQADHPGSFPEPGLLCNHFQSGTSMCTQQYTWTNTPGGFNGVICSFGEGQFHGHVNWSPATYYGQIWWGDHSGDDDDYNFEFVPVDSNGLTANRAALHLEMDSDETVDNIGSGWWNDFHRAVDNGTAGPIIAAKRAIVIGLLGLDAEHTAYTELHPLYGLAIETNDAPSDDTWAILARNWGNEGYCAADESENLEVRNIRFFIPHAGTYSVSSAKFYRRDSSTPTTVNVATAPGGVLVDIELGEPAQQNIISGELHLAWSADRGGSGGSQSAAFTSIQVLPQSKEDAGEAEEVVKRITTTRMKPAQLAKFQRPHGVKRFSVNTPVQVVLGALPAKQTSTPHVSRQADPRKAQRSLIRARLLCEATNNKVPGVRPSVCVRVRLPASFDGLQSPLMSNGARQPRRR